MIQNEKLLPLVAAVEVATGRRFHPSTPIRWATRGIHGVKLETAVLGIQRLTSPDAVVRFMNELTRVTDGRRADS
jgi:hypothetical protein